MPLSRIIVWVTTVSIIVYDIIASLLGWTTISDQVRVVDDELGGLFRFIMIALWCHWFLPSRWR